MTNKEFYDCITVYPFVLKLPQVMETVRPVALKYANKPEGVLEFPKLVYRYRLFGKLTEDDDLAWVWLTLMAYKPQIKLAISVKTLLASVRSSLRTYICGIDKAQMMFEFLNVDDMEIDVDHIIDAALQYSLYSAHLLWADLKRANKQLMKYPSKIIDPQVKTVEVEVEVPDIESQKRVAELEYQLEVLRAVCADRGKPVEVKEAEDLLIKEDTPDVDLSGKRIMVVTGTGHSNCFDYECVDIDRNPKLVQKLRNADLVVFDTKHISHHTYWDAKQECVNAGVKYLHYGRRDKALLHSSICKALSK